MVQQSPNVGTSLQEAVKHARDAKRPLLHHLNADSSWLLQLPVPPTASSDSTHWYNILIDPWLSGSQSDVASWFSQQWHATPSATPSISALEQLLSEIETLTDQHLFPNPSKTLHLEKSEKKETISHVHLIAISHEFTDHCHKETLLQCSRDIPVLATKRAASLIRSWSHFRTVQNIAAFPTADTGDWREIPQTADNSKNNITPPWLRVARLTSTSDALDYHSGLAFFFPRHLGSADNTASNESAARTGNGNVSATSEEEDYGTADAVIYTPHGIYAKDLAFLPTVVPAVRTLALLHGLHEVRIAGNQLNLGACNGLEIQRILAPRYWIGTHDEAKVAGGFVKLLLRRKVLGVLDALGFEKAKRGLVGSDDDDGDKLQDVSYVELGNGEHFPLK